MSMRLTLRHTFMRRCLTHMKRRVLQWYTHSLTYLLTDLLTHSLTHLLTHSLTYLLTHSRRLPNV